MMKFANNITLTQSSRISDKWGGGQYGDSRAGGKRLHKGLDIAANVGERVFSPITGTITREALPYAKDLKYRGLLLVGDDEWKGYEVKLFYVQGIICGKVSAGQHIANAQNLTLKYPGITNHIHIEVKKNGAFINPFELWQMCF